MPYLSPEDRKKLEAIMTLRVKRKDLAASRRAALKHLVSQHRTEFSQITGQRSYESYRTPPTKISERGLSLIVDAVASLRPQPVVFRLLEKIGAAEESGPSEDGYYTVPLEMEDKTLIREALEIYPYNLKVEDTEDRLIGGAGI